MRTKNNLLLLLLVSATVGCLTFLFISSQYTQKYACEKKRACTETRKTRNSEGDAPVFESSFTHLIVSTKN